MLAPHILVVVDEDLPDRGIGKAFVTTDNGFDKTLLDRVALAVEIKNSGKCQTVLVGNQTAQIIGDLLRQHGDDPAGKVNRGTAFVGIFIKGCSWSYEVADIGNGNIEPKSLLGLDNGHGIVKVFGRFSIDRDMQDLPQIFPAFRFGNFFRQLRRLLPRLLAKIMGQLEFLNHQPHLDINGVRITEDLNDLAPEIEGIFGALCKTDDDRIPLSDFLGNSAIYNDRKRKTGSSGVTLTLFCSKEINPARRSEPRSRTLITSASGRPS